jgi:hypothetical protein
LNKNLRYNVVDYAKNHKYYPFNIPFWEYDLSK